MWGLHHHSLHYLLGLCQQGYTGLVSQWATTTCCICIDDHCHRLSTAQRNANNKWQTPASHTQAAILQPITKAQRLPTGPFTKTWMPLDLPQTLTLHSIPLPLISFSFFFPCKTSFCVKHHQLVYLCCSRWTVAQASAVIGDIPAHYTVLVGGTCAASQTLWDDSRASPADHTHQSPHSSHCLHIHYHSLQVSGREDSSAISTGQNEELCSSTSLLQGPRLQLPGALQAVAQLTL